MAIYNHMLLLGAVAPLSVDAEANTVLEVLHRAGLFWDRKKLGFPRTLLDVVLVSCSARASREDDSCGGGTSVLDAAGVPSEQQELLRQSWWHVFSCRPRAYQRIGQLQQLQLVPREVRLSSSDAYAQQAQRAGANATLHGLAEWHGAPMTCDGHGSGSPSTPSFFSNATCVSLMSGLTTRRPPNDEWCQLYRETRGTYRLGDVIERVRHQKHNSPAAVQVLRDFPDSIAASYLRVEGHGANNVALLHRILRAPRYSDPPRLEAVIHLRTGDTVEGPGTSIVQFLCDRNALGIHAFNPPVLGAYVKPLCYFESAADELWARGVRVVHILSGNHAPAGAPSSNVSKSCGFIHAVGAYFAQRFRVVYLLNLTADDGFAAASRSRYFVPSGGGFSALIAKMVTEGKGNVIKGGCALLSADFGGPASPREAKVSQHQRSRAALARH